MPLAAGSPEAVTLADNPMRLHQDTPVSACRDPRTTPPPKTVGIRFETKFGTT